MSAPARSMINLWGSSRGLTMADMTDSVTEERTPRYTVTAVARRLGVAPATLRTWDRRYGLGPGDHEAGTRRRYTPHDLAVLELMRRLTLDGVAPAEAARLALAADLAGTPAGGTGGAGGTGREGGGRAGGRLRRAGARPARRGRPGARPRPCGHGAGR